MSLLSPWGLALGVLSVPIIALYFLKWRRQRHPVPSTFLWQQALRSEQTARPFDRFKRHPLLLLQLLLLLVLSVALARPSVSSELRLNGSTIVIIDISASMMTEETDGTRLKLAIDEALNALYQLDTDDEVMIIESGLKTRVILPFTQDIESARRALRGVRATDTPGSLRPALQLALAMARAKSDVEIVLYSDGGDESLADLNVGQAALHFVSIGDARENSGIVALDLRQVPHSERQRELLVSAQNSGEQPQNASLSVFINDSLVDQKNTLIAPGAVSTTLFTLGAEEDGVIRVELRAEVDHLASDNTAYAVLKAAGGHQILLVDPRPLTVRALSADPRTQLTLSTSETLTKAQLSRADAVLFERTVSPLIGGKNYGVLGPAAGGALSFGAAIDGPEVLDWAHAHAALRFVDWSGVAVARSYAITANPGLKAIVHSNRGPLVLAGTVNGSRVLQLAFDPLESDLPMRVGWPVFLINAVSWLTEREQHSGHGETLHSGAPYVQPLPEGTTDLTVRGPTGRPLQADINDGLLRVQDTHSIGVYTVDGPDIHERFAVNLLSPAESNIRPKRRLSFDRSAKAEADGAVITYKRELWRSFGLFALLILLIEWAVWTQKEQA